jgi:hypothetical protein
MSSIGLDYLPGRSEPQKSHLTPLLPPMSKPDESATSLTVRFPASLVQALDLKKGKAGDLHRLGPRSLKWKKASITEILARLHQLVA